MLEVELSPEVERILADISARTGDAPEELARWALLAYLQDFEAGIKRPASPPR